MKKWGKHCEEEMHFSDVVEGVTALSLMTCPKETSSEFYRVSSNSVT